MTAQNVIARHNLLEGAIGTFKEEKEAYWIVTLLMWLLPTIVVAGAAIDAMLVIAYLKYAHPWKGILDEEKGEIVKKKQCKKATRVCKPNSFSDKTQRWKLNGQMLKNKEGAWKSDDRWIFKPKDGKFVKKKTM